jgi:UDP-glucuronate 4-epimerase
MRILLTGGGGFIGSHVLERLLRDRHEVEVIDNLCDFYAPTLKLRNLADAKVAGEFVFHQIDICDGPHVRAVFAAFKPEIVVHIAAEAGLRRSLLDPLRYEITNVQGTLTLLEACKDLGVRKFIFASSSSVYGATNQIPFREDDERLYPLSPYAATKLAGEKLCYVYAHVYNVKAICLRLFTVYGPRQRPDLAIRKFLEQMEAGARLTIFGDGSSSRDYTFVDDVVDGICKAVHYESNFDIFNLGNARPISLAHVISVIEDAVGKKALMTTRAWHASEARITCACIEKARKSLGYNPQTPFIEGIRKSLVWLRQVGTFVPSESQPPLQGRGVTIV